MARPVKKRSFESFFRDIELITRLRMSLQLRHSLRGEDAEDIEDAKKAIALIDELVELLGRMMVRSRERDAKDAA